jgi:hypothetical protein
MSQKRKSIVTTPREKKQRPTERCQCGRSLDEGNTETCIAHHKQVFCGQCDAGPEGKCFCKGCAESSEIPPIMADEDNGLMSLSLFDGLTRHPDNTYPKCLACNKNKPPTHHTALRKYLRLNDSTRSVCYDCHAKANNSVLFNDYARIARIDNAYNRKAKIIEMDQPASLRRVTALLNTAADAHALPALVHISTSKCCIDKCDTKRGNRDDFAPCEGEDCFLTACNDVDRSRGAPPQSPCPTGDMCYDCRIDHEWGQDPCENGIVDTDLELSKCHIFGCDAVRCVDPECEEEDHDSNPFMCPHCDVYICSAHNDHTPLPRHNCIQ